MSLIQELKRRNVIRVALAYLATAWLVLQVVDTISPFLDLDDTVGRIALIALAIGFVPVLILAWVFEWTPDGVKLDVDADHDSAASMRSARTLDRVIIAVLTAAVVYFVIDEIFVEGKDDSYYGDRSVVVLPFATPGDDPQEDTVALGVTYEIHDLLTRMRNLRVISRYSVDKALESDPGIREIGEMLGVGHVLEGSVRLIGDSVRVTARIFDSDDERQLWSASYERDLDDIAALQDDIAATVAEKLDIELLGPPPRSSDTDPRIRMWLLQAKQLQERRAPDSGKQMKNLLDRILEIDPDNVRAILWMSYANMFLAQSGDISREQEAAEWERIKQRVLELDPDNASLKTGFAWEAAYLENDYERAAILFSEAVTQDPNDSELIRLASTFAAKTGRFTDAIRLGRHAVAIDPLCYMCVYHLSRAFMYAGRYAESRQNRERYLALGAGGHMHNALLYLLEKKPQAAYDYLLEVEAPPPGTVDFWTHEGFKAMALFDLGRTDEAAALLAEIVTKADEFGDYLLVAIPAGWMGRNDLAFEYLFRHADSAQHSHFDIFSPEFIRLRDDPRWAEYREAVDLSEERLAALEFNPVLPE
ncbi:MAG: hypothetical protein R3358_04945 [Woeseiaceae bacterium]|nr:hypothetical protein [Woeseiaceae bacterium]